ncbi:SDR family oxidoreductase [Sanguibacter sp. A247]|uniref:SDR family oxidoreductase n=1 Tax=unclassified Sanguibacter TaxID=2645534 RepID=UPI003FD73A91
MQIAVTGATGHLGRLAIDALITRGLAPQNITAIVRDAAKASDLANMGVQIAVAAYEDETALTAALQGVDRLLFISGSEVGQRVAQHTNIVNAAKRADVKFIVYTSLLNLDTSKLGLAPEHAATESLLSASGIDHALLRNGWYWENFASALDSGRATGKFFGAAGAAQVSGAARRDYAEAAAVVVMSENQAGKIYELAGSPSLSYQGIADAAGAVIGSQVTYVNQSVEDYRATLESVGMPAPVAALFASMEPVIEAGALYSESTDLPDLIGRPTTSATDAFSAVSA